MKKVIALIICLACLCAFAGCAESSPLYDRIPMLMVDGKIYTDTGKQMSLEMDESAILGEITSAVDGTEKPTQDGQSNFGGIGAPYAYLNDGVVVLLSNEWTFFQPEQ